ncbi:MAG: helix-turn-helix domain-containing protein [Planctomycetia bacterium]|nr:helix-turn-helix domain-containing protein [Planctomycetia bacterium]
MLLTAVRPVAELDRARLEEMAAGDDPERVRRARIVLLSLEGRSDAQVAATLGISRKTAWRWRMRFADEGFEGIERERPRTGRKPKVQDRVSRQIIDTTLSTAPPRGSRWSTRLLAEFLGVSRAMVHRVWRKHGIVPPTRSAEPEPA